MKTLHAAMAGVFVVALMAVPAVPARAASSDAMTRCTMKFNLRGWSFFYQTAHGSGVVTCDNGEKADVTLKTEGGGLTFGKEDVVNGTGTFSAVQDIKNIYGSYAAAGANAGAVKSSQAAAMTKGEVSMALSGSGQGFDLGVAFSKFTIEPAGAKK